MKPYFHLIVFFYSRFYILLCMTSNKIYVLILSSCVLMYVISCKEREEAKKPVPKPAIVPSAPGDKPGKVPVKKGISCFSTCFHTSTTVSWFDSVLSVLHVLKPWLHNPYFIFYSAALFHMFVTLPHALSWFE